jgi:hypothetical protein
MLPCTGLPENARLCPILAIAGIGHPQLQVLRGSLTTQLHEDV